MVARRLGVSSSCVSNWIRRGLLPAARAGNRWVIRSEDLAVFAVTHQRGHRFFKTLRYLN